MTLLSFVKGRSEYQTKGCNNSMKVEILNPEVLADLYKNHGIFACNCYNTPEKYAENVGKKCESNGHMSGSRCEYIKFRISDVDRGTAEQCLRHEIGTSIPFDMQDNYNISDYADVVVDVSPDQIVKNMASFRYIEKDGFKWATPNTIAMNDRAKELYDELMMTINTVRKMIKDELEASGVPAKKATEDANFVLPRATTTSFVIGFTPEALIHFCHKRLCLRAQEFIRQIATLMRIEVNKYSHEFALELVPHCAHLLWCPEGSNSCGLCQTKEQLCEKLRTIV